MKAVSLFCAATALFVACTFIQCKKTNSPTSSGSTDPVVAAKSVVFEQTELLSAQSEKKRLGTILLATDFSATGLYVPAAATIKVNVEQKSGNRLPALLIGTYYRYGTTSTIAPQEVALKAGVNDITSPLGGLIWIRYTNDAPNSKAKITFISGFEKVPYYIAGSTTNSQWKNMLATMTTVPDVILQGERCMLVVKATMAVKYQDEDQNALLTKISRIIQIEDASSGLDGLTDRDRPNVHQRYLLTQDQVQDTYFFSSDYGSAFLGSEVFHILKPDDVIWGVWHELGHMHQQIWTWSTVTEVTVNIFTRDVEGEFTPDSNMLISKGAWDLVPVYLAKPDAERDFNDDISIGDKFVFVRLCMFEQLQLAFGNDFYPKLMKKARLDSPVLTTKDQKMDYFMKAACIVSGRDLSIFFKKWGLNVNSNVYTEMAALGLPAPAKVISVMRD